MTGLLLSLIGGVGVFYLFTAFGYGWDGLQPGPTPNKAGPSGSSRAQQWLVQAGLEDVKLKQFVAVVLALFCLGALLAFAIFGGIVPAIVLGGFVATMPLASYRHRRQHRRERAHESWPHMIEEIRIMTGSAGRSVPQALFEVGRRASDDLAPAFEAAHREWLLTTDFERTLDVLKGRLADPTADVTCETLLVAHQLGGTDLDQRLASLAEDRTTDSQGRKDAVARQAGARFARWFTLVVPVGMALVGMSIGEGRDAFATGYGQGLVVVALAIMILCWAAASHIMKLPDEQRLFHGVGAEPS
jgi:tight adherence protein B